MTQTYYAKVEKTEYSSINLEFTATSEEDAKIKALKIGTAMMFGKKRVTNLLFNM